MTEVLSKHSEVTDQEVSSSKHEKSVHSGESSIRKLNENPEKEPTEPKPLVNYIKKRELDPFLKCTICTGFFRDAHTINECLCSFCKACIYKYFCADAKRENCPKCQTSLGGKPLKSVIADTTL